MTDLAKTVYSAVHAGSTPAGLLQRAESDAERFELLMDLYLDAREWRAEESQIIAAVKREVNTLGAHVAELYAAIVEPEPVPSFDDILRAAYRRRGGQL